jgi:uncharacterized protein YPO0396
MSSLLGQIKKLCRIRLINWHYFINETITVKGSFLISGENTSGKSTVLDAIKLVLTANTRNFNAAANEKSSRDLKGYVRCKTGNENSFYNRTGSIISYVALEFFEESSARYFLLGIKIDSPDEESKLVKKWFKEEGRLEEISFLKDQRPCVTEEFRKNDKKIQLISHVSEARKVFARRLGNLENTFFDLIPKSMAFKPMGNVKEFIHKFILPPKNIEVSSLKNNIKTLKEFEDLMVCTREKLEKLKNILLRSNDIKSLAEEIRINEIMIARAQIESVKEEIKELTFQLEIDCQELDNFEEKEKMVRSALDNERQRLTNLQIALGENEAAVLVTAIKHRIDILNKELETFEKSVSDFDNMFSKLSDILVFLDKNEIFVLSKEEFLKLNSITEDIRNKSKIIYFMENEFNSIYEKYNSDLVRSRDLLTNHKSEKIFLIEEIKNLRNKKLSYPENTVILKNEIEKEFENQEIKSRVRIFSDLLEITDTSWQNAVEGYLADLRFYLVVEPAFYPAALLVYKKIRNRIHTAGLVDTPKLDINICADPHSLARTVKSENSLAAAYAAYLLNPVLLCPDAVSFIKTCSNENSMENNDAFNCIKGSEAGNCIKGSDAGNCWIGSDAGNCIKGSEIDNCGIAIEAGRSYYEQAVTKEGMLYRNRGVTKIDDKIFNTPYIGARAYEIQLKNRQDELARVNEVIKSETEKISFYSHIINCIKQCNFDDLKKNINARQKSAEAKECIAKETLELEKAESNPNYLEIKIEIKKSEKELAFLDSNYREIIENMGKLKNQIETDKKRIKEKTNSLCFLENTFKNTCLNDEASAEPGIRKFEKNLLSKSPGEIVLNFSARNSGLENRKNSHADELVRLQSSYCSLYDCDFGTGYDYIEKYIQEHFKLESSEIIKFEEELKKARENCEIEFRESFLARLRENIENAQLEFKLLNSALKNIYYGDDSYRFIISKNKRLESIYKMIMSKNNLGDFSLWSQSFEKEYKQEMEDLFLKLTAHDDKGENVLAEYTDYRSYLDYDIKVEKKDGSVQLFSRVYNEKSGGETQTPYYVAIAASFSQLYGSGDSIRIIILDEAFDKMDENRISSMMDFFNKQGFQIIIAAPPAKMEIIGEKVNTVLMAIRDGNSAIIEEYDL